MYAQNRRLAALLAAAALGAGTALLGGVAHAAPANPTVEFSGGSVLNMLVCRSQPSNARLTVPAESRVTFVNRLGQNGVLSVDGRTVTSVGANQAVPVVFHYGPVVVLMRISCNVGVVEEFHPVTVTVTPRAGMPAAAGSAGSTGSAAAAASGSTRVGGAAQGARSAAPTPPVDAGAMPADPWALSPSVAGTAEGAANGSPPAADVGDVVAASGEPVHGPSGLLAMVATVLTIGVGVAAVRSVLARRTSRARFA